jgi:hypothetical protein
VQGMPSRPVLRSVIRGTLLFLSYLANPWWIVAALTASLVASAWFADATTKSQAIFWRALTTGMGTAASICIVGWFVGAVAERLVQQHDDTEGFGLPEASARVEHGDLGPARARCRHGRKRVRRLRGRSLLATWRRNQNLRGASDEA